MLTKEQLQETILLILDHCIPTCSQMDYRLVGTGAALLQGVQLPTADIDILVKDRESVNTFSSSLSTFKCLFAPNWIKESRQFYSEYEVNGVGVGISTVEVDTESDGLECVGYGPWKHFTLVPCGPYNIPAVALELRLVSELIRNRPDRYKPLIQHMQVNGCDVELVGRGMVARGLPQDLQEKVFNQLKRSD
jgi:hypothetical protein